jgi:hypothetical protein
MLEFEKFGDREFNELKTTIQKSVEKSDLDRYYLFSTDKMIKAKLFILCYRFLLNAWNLTGAGALKDELKNEIDLVTPLYENISYFMNFIDSGRRYGKHLITEKLFYEVNQQEVTDLIDVFAILTERVNVISMARFKGVIMEGKSGDEFNRIIRGDDKRRHSDEDMQEEEEEPLAPVEDQEPKLAEPVEILETENAEPVEPVEKEPEEELELDEEEE